MTEYNGGTIFSPGRVFRYTLERFWNNREALTSANLPGRGEGRAQYFVQFIGLNPSKADEIVNDNTVTKCMNLARYWGFGGMVMTNLHACLSTDPAELYRLRDAGADSQGPDNLHWIQAVAQKAGLIVCAWGNHGELLGRGQHVADILTATHPEKVAVLARKELRGHSGAGIGVPKIDVFSLEPILTKSGHPGHPCRLSSKLTCTKWKGYSCR